MAKAAKSAKTAARILKKSVSRKKLKGAKKATKLIMKSNNRATWIGAITSNVKSSLKNAFCYGGLWTVKCGEARWRKRWKKFKALFRR